MSFWTSFMNQALALAQEASATTGDVPVGALLVDRTNEVFAIGVNAREATGDSTAHAEIVAIREASLRRGNWNLEDLTLVVTLEPCAMCAGAIRSARISRVVFGAWDEAYGASGSVLDILRDPRLGKPTEVLSGIMEAESRNILKSFFTRIRAESKN
jgi:tRNA(adenine34) deaminase